MRWRIFYADRTSFEGEPQVSPLHGVIAVVQQLAPGDVRVEHQSDFYWWRDGRWWGGDIHGFVNAAARFGASWVRQGQTVYPDEYQEIMADAVALKDEWMEG